MKPPPRPLMNVCRSFRGVFLSLNSSYLHGDRGRGGRVRETGTENVSFDPATPFRPRAPPGRNRIKSATAILKFCFGRNLAMPLAASFRNNMKEIRGTKKLRGNERGARPRRRKGCNGEEGVLERWRWHRWKNHESRAIIETAPESRRVGATTKIRAAA